MIEFDECIALYGRKILFILNGNFFGGFDDLCDTSCGSRALGIHNENSGNRHHCHGNQSKILHKGDNGFRVRRMVCNTGSTERNNCRNCRVHQKRHDRVGSAHDRTCVAFVMGQLFVDFVVTAMFIFRFGKCLDDTDTLRIFSDNANHAVNGILYSCVERDTFFGNEINSNEDKGKYSNHDERKISVHQKRDGKTADQKNRGTNAHSLHHTDKTVQIIGVGRNTGFQGGNCKFIRLRRGKAERVEEKIVTNLFREVTRDLCRHAVGDDVQYASRTCTENHQTAPFDDLQNVLGYNNGFKNMAEYVRKQKLHERTCNLNHQPYRHSAVKGLQITEHDFHFSVSSFS